MVNVAPLVLGIRGPMLGDDERALITRVRPASFILFARNIQTPGQVRELTSELTALSPLSAPLIAVDQEGGRVQRLTFEGKLPAAKLFGLWYDASPSAALEATRLWAMLLAAQVRSVGGTWVMAPCLDVAHPDTHAIIGDRAFHANPAVVAALGKAHLEGTRAGGCLPCLKHAPGHGRAVADSHHELPSVGGSADELAGDFYPFKVLAAHSPFMMTAHICYPHLMAQGVPVTFSPDMLARLRQEWAYDGLILADDLGMNALQGSYASRAERALAAGCDVLITSFSTIKQGMAGAVFDEETYQAFVNSYTIPPLGASALAKLNALQVPPAPNADDTARALSRLRALWADGPARMGYAFPQ